MIPLFVLVQSTLIACVAVWIARNTERRLATALYRLGVRLTDRFEHTAPVVTETFAPIEEPQPLPWARVVQR